MNLLTEVRPGPNRYVSGNHILKDLPLYLQEFQNIAVITGDKSYEVFQNYYPAEFKYPVFKYDGTSSDEDAKRLASEIKKADAVVVIGGGKVIDTAKLVVEELKCKLIVIPTIVSNCAPFVPVTVVYDQATGNFRRMDFMSNTTHLVLVDWDLLLTTPRDYFIAGIADTIAKWYECEIITRHLEINQKKACVQLGIVIAKETFNILMRDSEAALASLEQQEATPVFGSIVDTIIALAGAVGGFGEEYCRIAGAHAIHDALSLIEETHGILHGAQVAYGIFVQLAYTNDWAEIEQLMPMYQQLNLPMKLADIHVKLEDPRLREVVDFAARSELSFYTMDQDVSGEKVFRAIEKLENFMHQKLS